MRKYLLLCLALLCVSLVALVPADAHGNRTFAFVGLERMGGVMIFDVTDPSLSVFHSYVNNRDFEGDPEQGTAGDLGPEGLVFIERQKGGLFPSLVVANEVSGTTTRYAIVPNFKPGKSNGKSKLSGKYGKANCR